ncbi:monocarboxylate transporter 12 [Lepeophtheirus salmonis]|uniref:monocarboxylate transporter 12 n=1 Tax=Lepeophtheirus salmonis TaxID=72036 RepID=UPI001AE256C1|nr:monocarboxylate transporter 12-like [Lepeophtheirus salmonis]
MSDPNKFDGIHCRRHVGGYNPISNRKNRKLTDILRARRLRIGRSSNPNGSNSNNNVGSISDSLNFNSEASNLSAHRTTSNSHSGITRNNSINSYQSARSYRSIKSNGTALTNLSSSFGGGRGSISKSSKEKFYRNSKYDDEVSEGQLGINEKDLNSMNKHIPALKSYGKGATLRQHYYPEGGWGWVITFCCFLVELFTTGLQLSFSILYLEIIEYTGQEYTTSTTWLGSTNFSLSCFMAPLFVALCRRKSTRLISIIGGLVMSLSMLFTSFAKEFHQVFLSYGIMCGIGISMVRETATIMLSQYFKRRRELVEMFSGSGAGFGIALFSNVYSSGISSYGWRFGLQLISIPLISLFFLGLFYRSASLYHPQRRAILHLKDMSKRKGKDKNKSESKPPYFDFASLKIRSFRIVLVSTVFTSMGVYTPLFFFVPMAQKEGIQDNVILLQTFLGLGVSLGIFGFGFVVLSKSNQCLISRQYLVQTSIFGIAISIFALISVEGYHGYLLFTWMYGVFFGGYLYSLKVYTYERLRVKHFNRGWGFIRGVQSLPILTGIPISMYTNTGNSKSGFYFSSHPHFLEDLFYFVPEIVGVEDPLEEGDSTTPPPNKNCPKLIQISLWSFCHILSIMEDKVENISDLPLEALLALRHRK